ncbi:hypothetical protein ACU4GI_16300 [Cupriavidus basilensis]|uniref:hypothetical protein n=1 Tax=Cupriavidus TaxID=106589 RepID=UPI000449393E|nr:MULTISPECIES: hypothetical protein [Cupriavidus]KDP85469.1 hypothetical protein CF70_013865 [Cupriavidus sp. SK-3]MDF3881891.1 hypothetical protein [Cupriavidus basilensis]
MNQEDMASAPYLAGQPLVGDVVAVGAIRPQAGDLVTVRSRIDPQVEFNTRLTLSVPGGTWKAVVFSIERAGEPLAEFGGVRLEDEVEISMDHFASMLRCVPPQ